MLIVIRLLQAIYMVFFLITNVSSPLLLHDVMCVKDNICRVEDWHLDQSISNMSLLFGLPL